MKRKLKQQSRPANTYKAVCDNHPTRPADWAFVEAKTGKSRGLCDECFDKERVLALRSLRIKRIRARRKT